MAEKRSDILIELDENVEEMKRLITKQTFKVEDAQRFLSRYFNIFRKMEQLVISRDMWKAKYNLRNDDAKDYAKEITRLQKELKNGN